MGAVFEWQHAFAHFLGSTPSLAYAGVQISPAEHAPHEHAHLGLAMFSTVLALTGVGLAAFFYLGDRQQIEQLTRLMKSPFGLKLYQLSSGKFYIDAIYGLFIVWPLRTLAAVSYWFDRWVIDGLVNLCGQVPIACGAVLLLAAVRHGAVLRPGDGAGDFGIDRNLVPLADRMTRA